MARSCSRRERTRGTTRAACCTTPGTTQLTTAGVSRRPRLARRRMPGPDGRRATLGGRRRVTARAALATCSTLLPLQAVQHLQRQLVTAERRHQIGALDALAHREQHLACDLHALLARGLAAGRLAH